MKNVLSFLFLLLAFPLLAGEYDFSPLQGLKNSQGDIWFEMSGYDIFAGSFKGNINQAKTIAAFKKKYKIKNIQAEYTDPQFAMPHKIIEEKAPLQNNPDIKLDAVYYLFQQSEKEIRVISFQTLAQRDIFLEQEFVKAFLADSLNGYISDNWKGEAISFAGRTIELGNACAWRSPHNFSCKGGQISWSEFSSPESAGLYLDARIAANNGQNRSILSKDYIEVLFEDVPTIAYRVAYKLKGNFYPLIVYYLEQEVRGHYLSCVMSNYGYNRNDYELSPLLQLFMSIPAVPDWAYNQFDVPELEAPSTKEMKRLNAYEKPVQIEIRPGLVTPLGNLRNVFKAAPMVDVFIGGYPVSPQMSIEVGVGFSFPVEPSYFDYKNVSSEAKVQSIVQGSIRYRYNRILKKDWTASAYFGAGFSSLNTNLVKQVNDDGTKNYYTIGALDFYGGFSIKYKFIGCFAEYHHSAYSNSSKVINNFGNNSLNFGFLIGF